MNSKTNKIPIVKDTDYQENPYSKTGDIYQIMSLTLWYRNNKFLWEVF